MTLILITHKTSMLDLVDRLIVMDRGRVVANGPKEMVLSALRSGSASAAPATTTKEGKKTK
jgi:ATP-binding cassette subfamily C protein LapB